MGTPAVFLDKDGTLVNDVPYNVEPAAIALAPGAAEAARLLHEEPGLMLRAAEDRDLDLARSWAIGDILNDVEAGHRAGARTILIDNGNETEWLLTPNRTPDYRVPNMAQAARIIVAADRDGR